MTRSTTSTVRPDRKVATGPASSGPAGVVVATHGLTKRFGGQTVVDDLSLTVPAGAVYGFLGPNGCGKTTTIRMVLGLAFPTAGHIDLLGARVPGQATSVLHRVGTLVEGPAFHPYLSGRANLNRLDAADVRAEPRSTPARIDTALDRVGLLAAAGKKYRAYSLGMRQRLAIAGALLAPRDLLVLDEPTNGLDPQGTREVRHLISSLAEDGITVLVSSHLLSEVEQMCSHIAVMREGRLLAEGPISELQAAGATTVVVRTREPEAAAATLRRLGLRDIRLDGGKVRATPTARRDDGSDAGSAVTPEQMVDALVGAGVPVRGFELRTPSLEDLFVELTGEGFDVSG